MKKFIFTIINLFYLSSFSQINSGKITYNITKEYNEESDYFKFYSLQYPDCFYDEFPQEIYYEIQFSKNQYLFYVIPDNITNKVCENLISTVIGTMGLENYKIFTQDVFYSYSYHLGNHLLISNQPFEWVITDETKTIQNFICYKAYYIETIDLGDEVKTNTHTVWFTPDLPFSYGPGDYYGLPGVILEANNMLGKYTYGASKIELNIENSKLESNIRKLQEISKEMTLDEFMEM